ncbi:hypothetical protein TTRE_0000805101 [Trichuris trichiura]|uniref:Uncharacterized protein n=1 Tax=Trichuris trichiura TaxID=36087 RepID=A0A077ZHD4_TRITR|nr:hypothetical protein TTRE_0000805101 [Trichuris trichiura]
MNVVNIAKELGSDGFSDMIEDDVREHIEDCGESFTNEELEELMQSPTGSDDQGKGLRDTVAEYYLSMERLIMVTQGITALMKRRKGRDSSL